MLGAFDTGMKTILGHKIQMLNVCLIAPEANALAEKINPFPMV